jgi:type I restriction enzyme S subunit
VRFGDVVENLNETCDAAETGIERFIAMEHLEPGSLHVREWGAVAEGTTFTRRCRAGQVLFGKRRAYQRKVAVAEFAAVVSGDIYVLAPRGDRLLARLLPFLCLSERFFQFAVETSAGSLSPRTNWSHLAQFEFDLPPLDQQRRISEILWEVDAVVKGYSEVADTCSALFDSTLLHLSIESPKHRAGHLEDFAEFITDGDHNPPPRWPSGIPHLVVRHVENGELRLDDCTFISESDFERVKKRYDPKPNDLVLTCVGTIGRIAVVPKDFVFSADRSLALIRPAQEKLIPEFAKVLLESAPLQAQMSSKAIGTAQLHLYLKDIRQLNVTIPASKTQSKILSQLAPIRQTQVNALSAVESSKRLASELISSLFGSNSV